MTTELRPTLRGVGARAAWELELDAELAPGSPAVTGQAARALADLLARIPGVDVVAVRPHCEGRFVQASLVVEASDLADAVDRACAFLRSSALAAGVGPLILVAVRSPMPRA